MAKKQKILCRNLHNNRENNIFVDEIQIKM